MRIIAYPVLALLLTLSTGCTGLFFYPERKLIVNPMAEQFGPADVFFKTPDGLALHGWYFRASGNALATMLVLHGNAQNLSTHVNSVLWLIPQGVNVFIFDYRGYGRSEGTPSLSGIHRDAEAALETLLTLPGVDRKRIIVLGQSLGGAVGVYLAANSPFKKNIKALVIDSAFSSYRLIAREKLGQVMVTWPFQYPLSYLFNDRYSPVRWVKKVSPVSILIMHGKQDPVAPVHHGRILYDTARDPKEFWQTTIPGHITSFSDEAVRNDFIRYVKQLFAATRDEEMQKQEKS